MISSYPFLPKCDQIALVLCKNFRTVLAKVILLMLDIANYEHQPIFVARTDMKLQNTSIAIKYSSHSLVGTKLSGVFVVQCWVFDGFTSIQIFHLDEIESLHAKNFPGEIPLLRTPAIVSYSFCWAY